MVFSTWLPLSSSPDTKCEWFVVDAWAVRTGVSGYGPSLAQNSESVGRLLELLCAKDNSVYAKNNSICVKNNSLPRPRF